MPEPLPLPHQLLLLELDDERGTSLVDEMSRSFLLMAAVVAELQVRDVLVATGADQFVIRESAPALQGALGTAVEELRGEERTLKRCVEDLGWWGGQGHRDQLVQELIELGALRREGDYFLFLRWRWRLPTANAEVEASVREGLRSYVDGVGSQGPPTREDLLLSLLRAGGLLTEVWTETELQQVRGRVDQRTDLAPIGRVVQLLAEEAMVALSAAMTTLN